MSILGLTTNETFRSNSFMSANQRRRVFESYPNGAATLVGLLSLMEDETTDNTEFGWFEKRFSLPRTTLGSTGASKGAWSATGSDTALADSFNMVAGTVYRIRVASSAEFRVADSIWIQDHALAAGGTVHIKGVVTEIVSSTKIEFRASQSITGVDNDDAAAVPALTTIGTANAEGATSGSGRLTLPVSPTNYTQIFRNAFSFTRSALKQPAAFDRTGIYRTKAKDNALDHMTGIEMAALFGTKRIDNVTSPDNETVEERKLGGLLWYLEQWELGNTGNGGAYNYRPVGSYDSTDVSAAADTNDLKRIINNTSGTMTLDQYNDTIRRAFDVTNNKAFEKLCLCGSGYLASINKMVDRYSVTMKGFPAEEAYGVNVIKHETPFGTLFYKTHPLFNRDPMLRYSAMIIDVQNLRYRPLTDSDTTLLKNRQATDADRRKDEWLTECGIEVRFPESHMFIRNLQNIS